MSPQAVTTRH